MPVPPKGLPPAEVAKLTRAAITLPPIRERPSAGDDEVSRAVRRQPDGGVCRRPRPTRRLREAADRRPDRGPQAVGGKTSAAEGSDGRPPITEFVGAVTDDVPQKARSPGSQETPARPHPRALDDRSRSDSTPWPTRLAEEKSAVLAGHFPVYAQAQVKARLAFMHEYNQLLGDVRTDRLPARDAEQRAKPACRLVSVGKMKSKQGRARTIAAKAARDLFDAVAKDHAGTPWAVAARRAKAEALGLEWRPFAPGGKPKAE